MTADREEGRKRLGWLEKDKVPAGIGATRKMSWPQRRRDLSSYLRMRLKIIGRAERSGGPGGTVCVDVNVLKQISRHMVGTSRLRLKLVLYWIQPSKVKVD